MMLPSGFYGLIVLGQDRIIERRSLCSKPNSPPKIGEQRLEVFCFMPVNSPDWVTFTSSLAKVTSLPSDSYGNTTSLDRQRIIAIQLIRI